MTTCHSCRFLSDKLYRAEGGPVEALCLNEYAPHHGAYRGDDEACISHEAGPAIDASAAAGGTFRCGMCGKHRAMSRMVATADGRPVCISCRDRWAAASATCAHRFELRAPYGRVCGRCGLLREMERDIG